MAISIENIVNPNIDQDPIYCVIPMTGQGTRFQAAGYKDPKPLIKVNGRPIIERLLSVFRPQWKYVFILAENHRNVVGLEQTLLKACPGAQILYQKYERKGPSWAVLSALDYIPPKARVFVSYCDYGMVWDPIRFEEFVRSSECDSCLVSYRGFHAHYLSPTNYAFSRMDGEQVVEVREKGNFTSNREDEYASAGAYYFRSAEILKFAIEEQMKQGLEMKGEWYTSLTVQALLAARPLSHVRVFEVPQFFQWGTPEDMENFEYWERTYSAKNRYGNLQNKKSEISSTNTKSEQDDRLSNDGIRSKWIWYKVPQLLMPMAGFGSRFQGLTKTPKPLIRLQGRPMFLCATDTLPAVAQAHYVTKQELCSEVKDLFQNIQSEPSGCSMERTVHGLAETPNGQALTTAQGLSFLNKGESLLISSCDHGVVLDPIRWQKFVANPQCDVGIFTIRGFPGATRRPEAYCYVEVEGSESNFVFPRITRVSVKKPLTAHPIQERILVGTFWFSSPELVQQLIQELVARDIRVNNEFYLDSVVNLLIEQGKVARVIELDGYINWGDPDSLREALYWQEVFGGRQLQKRATFPGTELGELK